MDPSQWKSTMDNPMFKEPVIEHPLDLLARLVQQDEDYQWGWYCNLRMNIADSGASDKVAKDSAIQLMSVLFNVRIKLHPLWVE